MIHVLGGGVTLAILVEIPAIRALGTLRALSTGVALGALRAGRTRVTLGPLRTGIALRTLGTGRAAIPGVTPGAQSAIRTSAILHVAGAVLIHVLGDEVTLAILVQIPAIQAVRALWTRVTVGALRTGGARGTLSTRLARVTLRPERTRRAVIPTVTPGAQSANRTSAILHVAGAVLIHVLGDEVTLAILVQIPAIQAVRALRTGVTTAALGTRVAVGTLDTRLARVTLGPLGTRVTCRTLRTHGTLAIQNRALAISICILRGEVAPSIGVQIPAVDSFRTRITLHALRARSTANTPRPHRTRGAGRPGWTAWTLRTHRSHRTRGADRARRTAWTGPTHRSHRTRGARRTGGTLRTPEADLNVPRLAPLADIIAPGPAARHQIATRRRAGRRCATEAPEPDQAERQL